jgi:signal transduction histidine kinase
VTLGELARLVVPELADWCAIDTLSDDGAVHRLAVAHVDPAQVTFAQELTERYPPDPAASTGVPNVLRTGRPELYPEITDEMLVASAIDDDHLRIVRELGLRSVMIVPLTARGRTRGALTLVSAESRRRYGDADLALALELGRRAGFAVDNARLLADAQAAAERTARLQTVTARLTGVLTPQEVAEAVVGEGVAALAAAAGAFCLLTPAGDELEVVFSTGLAEDVTHTFQRFNVDAPLPLSDAVRTGEPVFLESRADVVARYPVLREANARATAEAWMALPLVIAGRATGGLAFGFALSRPFTPEDRALGLALAQQASQALERARLYTAEQAARADAEAANHAKSDFLATMSHELRTPLNAIGGYAELLEMGLHGPVTEPQRDALKRIQRSQRHLLSLIEDILSFARIDAGRLTLDMTDVPLRDLITDLEPLVAPQIRAKGLAFDFENCDSSLTAHADGEKVRQILLNLLSNAIKFTPPGGQITVAGTRSNERVELRVRDTGIGIPTDKLGAIFDPFVQLGRTLTNAREGTGLGLSISRHLARAMGGELTVESEVGAGSVFTLSLPAHASP